MEYYEREHSHAGLYATRKNSSQQMTRLNSVTRLQMILLLFANMGANALGARIRDCSTECVDAVEGNTGFRLNCDNYNGTIEWQYRVSSGPPNVEIGTCGVKSCQVNQGLASFYQLQYVSPFSSRLIFISSDTTSRTTAGYSYVCDNASCCVQIIVPAVLETPSVALSLPSQGNQVSVTGSVDITRVYSSRGQYNCTWSRRQGGQSTQVSSQDLFPGSNPTQEDKSGTCDFTDNLPPTPATYIYTVLVYPGATEETHSVTVATPTTPTITCTPTTTGYVSEDTDLSCTCGGSVGRPAGRLVLVRRDNNVDTRVKTGGYGQESLQLTMRVNRTHNGNTLRCDVDWVTDTEGSPVTINVAYGPDSVSIPEDRTFYTDSTGSRTLTLTCNPSGVSPTSGLTFTWTGPCADVTNNTCNFRPRPRNGSGNVGDVGAEIECRVRNPFSNNKESVATFRLQLKYPPRLPPRIQGYSNNHVLYQTQPLNINCTVGDSDPPVTSVTLTCTGHPQSPTNGQSSSLGVTSLTENDDGAECMCSGNWVKPEYYTVTDSRILTVYYPPSAPDVRPAGGVTRPYLEGDNVTLTCTVTSRGHPAANLTWSGHERGEVTADDVMRSTLRLGAVGRGDNQRNVTCHAVNDFTRWKPLDLSDRYTLQVYYGPDVTVNSSAGNTCSMLPDHVTCTVLEGQRVHFRSHADSNPPQQHHVWRAPGGSGLDLDPGSDLDIGYINRTHSGVYRVQVNASNPDVTDSRLPLTSHRDLTVLVKYNASDITVEVNGANTSLTINESNIAIFNCQSRGRPTPELQLIQRGSLLHREEGGKLSLSEVTTLLNYTVTAQCHHTGLYTCNANNGVGGPLQDTVQLYVNCKPHRLPDHSTGTPVLKYSDGKGFLNFGLIAFPVPNNFSFKLNVNDTLTDVKNNIVLNATCFAPDDDFNVTCTVNATHAKNKEAEGLYTFTAKNAFGQENFTFSVTINETANQGEQTGTELDIAAIAGGAGAAVVVIAVAALVVFLIKRRKTGGRKSQRSHSQRNGTSLTEEPDMIVNELYGTASGGTRKDPDEEMIVNTLYESSEGVGKGDIRVPANAYEDVELNSRTNQAAKPKLVVTGVRNASSDKEKTPAGDQTRDGDSNLYATVNKSKKSDGPGKGSGEKQKPDVKPKPAKAPKAEKQKGTPAGHKKQDEKHLLRAGNYSNVALAPLTMTPTHKAEGSVYENFGFEKDDSGKGMPNEVDAAPRTNEDGLVYTTIAFSENQLKKAEDPPPERETTEYADIDFMRKAPPKKTH